MRGPRRRSRRERAALRLAVAEESAISSRPPVPRRARTPRAPTESEICCPAMPNGRKTSSPARPVRARSAPGSSGLTSLVDKRSINLFGLADRLPRRTAGTPLSRFVRPIETRRESSAQEALEARRRAPRCPRAREGRPFTPFLHGLAFPPALVQTTGKPRAIASRIESREPLNDRGEHEDVDETVVGEDVRPEPP